MMIRRPIKNRVSLLILILVVFFGVTGCETTGTSKAGSSAYVQANPNILRVGVSTSAPPLIYKQGQEIVGLEAELAREFAKYLGKSVQFVELKWADQIPALLDNRIDIIMSGMSRTKMREIRIAFSEPYFRTGQMALIHQRDKNRFVNGYYSIAVYSLRLKFGVVKATTGEAFVRKDFRRAKKIFSYTTSKEAVKALNYREVDLVIHDAPIILMLAAENETKGLVPVPSLMTEEYLAWGIRKNDVDLLASANTFIDTLEDDGRLNTIVNRWIPFKN